MKKSEMLEHIEAELLEAINAYLIASVKAKPHVLRYRADSMLAMIEGFGMLPPEREIVVYPKNDGSIPVRLNYIDYVNTWEKEVENS